MPITPMPTAYPARTQTQTDFNANMAALMAWWPTFNSDFNAMATQVSTDAANATAAASGAANTKWVSGTTYAIGDRRWSPATYGDYRRKTVGAGTTDPSTDTTNWASTFAMAAPIFTGTVTGGSLTLADAGARIKGDFSTATIVNRAMFQTSTVNGTTTVMAIPNGTGNAAQWNVNTSGTDPDNGSEGRLVISGTSGLMSIQSSRRGVGTFLPLSFYTSDVSQLNIATTGAISTATDLTVGGNIFCSAGMVLKSYTTATRPAHATGKMIYVTDGAAGSKVQTSDGATWLPTA